MNGGGQYGQAVASATISPSDPAPPPHLGFWGRLWARGSGLNDTQAAAALPALSSSTLGLFWGLGGSGGGLAVIGALIGALSGKAEVAAMLGGAGALLAVPGLLSPGPFFRSLHKKPLTPGEVETLLAATPPDHALERAYLNLALAAIRQPSSRTRAGAAGAEDDVRDALRALGEAIDNLPPGAQSGAPDVDTTALQRDAQQTLVRAETEPDPVIGASLRRRAEALERAAEAANRSALLLRRGAALRDELLAQTEALRLGLTAFDAGGSVASLDAGANLRRLAESVRDVAHEARSVALAREELDAAAAVPVAGPAGTQHGTQNSVVPVSNSVGSVTTTAAAYPHAAVNSDEPLQRVEQR